MVKLKIIATIHMGYPFRTRLDDFPKGHLKVIQMKELLDNNTINYDNLTEIYLHPVQSHHFVQEGDLLFKSRGKSTTATILRHAPKDTFASAPLLIIRVDKPHKIFPEYLNWFINQRPAQRYFKSRQEGTSAIMINKKQLENLEVTLPSLEKQHLIVDLASLAEQEQDLLHTIQHKKKQLISKTLMQLAEGDKI